MKLSSCFVIFNKTRHRSPSTDVYGHEITIETHFPDGYYVVKRWVPKNDKFGTLAYSILWLGERSKIEGHLKSEIREHYSMP